MLEIIVISLVQGVTEFLPISSSAHLVIFSTILNFTKTNLLFDISLHIGSFLAVIVYFKNEIIDFINYKKIFFLILLASIPTIIFGYFLVKFNIAEDLRTLKIIGWTTLIFGIILYFADKFRENKNIENHFNFKSCLYIGLSQILSLIPGVSRSGITISTSRILGFDRVNSAKISFLLSLPTLLAVSFYGIFSLNKIQSFSIANLNFLGLVSSFFFSYLTILLFINFIKKFNFLIFVIYRVILGGIILIYAYL